MTSEVSSGLYDPQPGYYCCVAPNCSHDREQIFHGGGGIQ